MEVAQGYWHHNTLKDKSGLDPTMLKNIDWTGSTVKSIFFFKNLILKVVTKMGKKYCGVLI